MIDVESWTLELLIIVIFVIENPHSSLSNPNICYLRTEITNKFDNLQLLA